MSTLVRDVVCHKLMSVVQLLRSFRATPGRLRLVKFLRAPYQGLPVFDNVVEWLHEVESWTEAARFSSTDLNLIGKPLLTPRNFAKDLYIMSPVYVGTFSESVLASSLGAH